MRLALRSRDTFYVPNDPDKGSIDIKHLKINEIRDIESKINQLSLTTSENGDLVRKMDVNPYPLAKRLAIESLEGWSNMKDELGKDMNFNDVNLEAAAEYVIMVEVDGKEVEHDFFSWVNICRDTLSKRVKQEQKDALENLKASVDG